MANKLPTVFGLLRRHFLAGLLILIPLGVITWIISSVLGSLWRLNLLLPDEWRPENFLPDPSLAFLLNLGFTIAGALFLALTISLLGWVSKQYLGLKALELVGEIIQRIPVVRSIYSALDQLIRALASGEGQQFSRVVYVEFPSKGIWTLAFVTGAARLPGSSEPHLSLFIPMTPNPTSGFYLVVPEASVRESNMKVEEAFKTILSLGIAQGAQGTAK